MTDIKPGWKTTEFWLTILASGIAFLVATGVISPDNSEAITAQGTEIVNSAYALIAAVLPIVGYTASRSYAKSKA